MYPIKFENLYYDKIWGGREFENFRDNLPKGNIAESWDISCNPHGIGIVANGKFKGMAFNELIEKYKEKVLGKSLINEQFPLLVKLINSSENLSVQVHPNDEYAKILENSYGKTEAWYVIDAKDNAELIVGTNGCTREEFEIAINNDNIEKYLNRIKIRKGDAFLINSGLIHAIGSGVVIVEIQQNSDITYRIYDYGRPRELHIEKALEVIDFNSKPQKLVENYKNYDGYKYTKLCRNKYFEIDKCEIHSKYKTTSEVEYFSIITCVEGKGLINYKNKSESIVKGDSILIPAQLGKYEIAGNLEILISKPVI